MLSTGEDLDFLEAIGVNWNREIRILYNTISFNLFFFALFSDPDNPTCHEDSGLCFWRRHSEKRQSEAAEDCADNNGTLANLESLDVFNFVAARIDG